MQNIQEANSINDIKFLKRAYDIARMKNAKEKSSKLKDLEENIKDFINKNPNKVAAIRYIKELEIINDDVFNNIYIKDNKSIKSQLSLDDYHEQIKEFNYDKAINDFNHGQESKKEEDKRELLILNSIKNWSENEIMIKQGKSLGLYARLLSDKENVKDIYETIGANENLDKIETEDIYTPEDFKPRSYIERLACDYDTEHTLEYDTVNNLAYVNAASIMGKSVNDIMENDKITISLFDLNYKNNSQDGSIPKDLGYIRNQKLSLYDFNNREDTINNLSYSMACAKKNGNAYLILRQGGAGSGHWCAVTIHQNTDGEMNVYLMNSSNNGDIDGLDDTARKAFLTQLNEAGKAFEGLKFTDKNIMNIGYGNQQVDQSCGLATANNLAGMIKFFSEAKEQNKDIKFNNRNAVRHALYGKNQKDYSYIKFRPYDQFGDEPINKDQKEARAKAYTRSIGKAQLQRLESVEVIKKEDEILEAKDQLLKPFQVSKSIDNSKLCDLLLLDKSREARYFRQLIKDSIKNKSANDIAEKSENQGIEKNQSKEEQNFRGAYDEFAVAAIKNALDPNSKNELRWFDKLVIWLKEHFCKNPWKNHSVIQDGIKEFIEVITKDPNKQEAQEQQSDKKNLVLLKQEDVDSINKVLGKNIGNKVFQKFNIARLDKQVCKDKGV